MEDEQTYKGIPISTIIIMYNCLRDGGIDLSGDYAKGFADGARYATERIEKDVRITVLDKRS